MRVFFSLEEARDEIAGGAVAIGNFDGVHIGHQALIKKTTKLSSKSGVLTFTPHPAELLLKNHQHFYLYSDEQKISLLKNLGVHVAILHRIDEDFLRISAEKFAQMFLSEQLKVKHVVVGDDFSFGYLAQGDKNTLINLGERFGFTTHIIDEISVDGYRVSSTNIKKALEDGELARANRMLGRNFSLEGIVIRGQEKGRVLGFKTANIKPAAGFLMRRGVYATLTKTPNGYHVGVTNIGFRPTLSNEKILMVETHLLDVDIDLYGQRIEVFFIERLRNEEKFSSITALQEQVQKDCRAVRQMHQAHPHRFLVAD